MVTQLHWPMIVPFQPDRWKYFIIGYVGPKKIKNCILAYICKATCTDGAGTLFQFSCYRTAKRVPRVLLLVCTRAEIHLYEYCCHHNIFRII